MANIRHVVIIRKDLEMPVGLACAQAAHICDLFIRRKLRDEKPFTPDEKDWFKDPYLSVLAVNTPEELKHLIDHCQRLKLQHDVWEDLIQSEILQKPIRCLIGISIGPDDFDKIKEVTGNLPLY